MSNNIFDLKNKKAIFDYLYEYGDDEFILKCEEYSINLFELKDDRGYTIFHKQECAEEFIYKHLEKYPTNLFELKDRYRQTIFHKHKYSEEFIQKHLEKYPTNLFELVTNWGCTIFHEHKYSEEFIQKHLEKYSSDLFYKKDCDGYTVFDKHDYSDEFFEKCEDIIKSKRRINKQCIRCFRNFNGFVIGPDNSIFDESTKIETPGEEQDVSVIDTNVVISLNCGHIIHPCCNNGSFRCSCY